MKTTSLVTFALLSMAAPAFAEQPVYVCGKEYTNTITAAQAAERKCKLFSGGGNVSIVQAQKPGLRIAAANPTPTSAGPRIDNADQRYKDSEARLILEAELKKAEAKHAELLKEYNNGEPEKLGPESRNYQKYLDRVAELKANIARNESDIAGIKRELGRVPSAPAGTASSSAQR
jgi:hypothetical protein